MSGLSPWSTRYTVRVETRARSATRDTERPPSSDPGRMTLRRMACTSAVTTRGSGPSWTSRVPLCRVAMLEALHELVERGSLHRVLQDHYLRRHFLVQLERRERRSHVCVVL